MTDYEELPLAVPASMMASTVAMLVSRDVAFKAEPEASVSGLWYIYRRSKK